MKISRRKFLFGAAAMVATAVVGSKVVAAAPAPVTKTSALRRTAAWKWLKRRMERSVDTEAYRALTMTTPRTVQGGFLVPQEFAEALMRSHCEVLRGPMRLIHLPSNENLLQRFDSGLAMMSPPPITFANPAFEAAFEVARRRASEDV